MAKELIRAYTRQSGQPWTELLLQITRCLNLRKTEHGHFSPEELHFRYRQNETDLIKKHTVVESVDDYVKTLTTHLEKIHQEYRIKREETADRKREQINKRKEERTFGEGDMVCALEKKITEGKGDQ